MLLSNLPFNEALSEALPYIRPLRNGNLPAEDLRALERLPEYITKSLTVYWNVWTGIAGCRLLVYAALAFFVYQSRGDYLVSSYTATAAGSGLDRLKNHVIFTFAFLEMMFWFWVSASLFFLCWPHALTPVCLDFHNAARRAPGTFDQVAGRCARRLIASPVYIVTLRVTI